jgi:hypothetical protein
MFSTLYHFLRNRPVSLYLQARTRVWSLYYTLLDWSHWQTLCGQFLGSQWVLLHQVIDFDRLRLWTATRILIILGLIFFFIWVFFLY